MVEKFQLKVMGLERERSSPYLFLLSLSGLTHLDLLKISNVAPLEVIVCDIGMPGKDGYTFLRKLRAVELEKGKSHIPAAALTAYTREEEKREALNAGFQIHLSKPIEEHALIHAIGNLTARQIMSQN